MLAGLGEEGGEMTASGEVYEPMDYEWICVVAMVRIFQGLVSGKS